ASLRSLIVNVFPPLLFSGISLATPGLALSFLSNVYKPSYTWLYISNDTVSVAKAVSKEEISCDITFLNTCPLSEYIPSALLHPAAITVKANKTTNSLILFILIPLSLILMALVFEILMFLLPHP